MKQWINYFKKILWNGGFFTLVVIITYRFVFSKINFNELTGLFYNLNIRYVFYGLLTAILMVCAEAYIIKRNFRLLKENIKYGDCLSYAFAGNFFSGITPAATGGQPMQLLLMHKNGIPVSKGTLALLMDLCAYQIAIITIAMIGYISYFEVINNSLGKFIPILWVGIILNFFILAITFLAIFSQKFIYSIISSITMIIKFFSIKKANNFNEKALLGVERYKKSANILRENKLSYLINVLITIVRILAMHSAPFWIYKSLGFSQATIFQILALQSTLYISCAAIPLPGGVGIGESGFMLYFKEIFPSTIIQPAMVLSRGIGFYFIMAFCGVSLTIVYLGKIIKKQCKRM